MFLTSDGVQTFSFMSIFSVLTNQNQLFRLLSIFIGSIKEAKRTFLTPDGGDTFRGSLEVYENGIMSFKISHSFYLIFFYPYGSEKF